MKKIKPEIILTYPSSCRLLEMAKGFQDWQKRRSNKNLGVHFSIAIAVCNAGRINPPE